MTAEAMQKQNCNFITEINQHQNYLLFKLQPLYKLCVWFCYPGRPKCTRSRTESVTYMQRYCLHPAFIHNKPYNGISVITIQLWFLINFVIWLQYLKNTRDILNLNLSSVCKDISLQSRVTQQVMDDERIVVRAE